MSIDAKILWSSIRGIYFRIIDRWIVKPFQLFNIEYNEDNNNDIVVMKDDEDFGEGERVADQPVIKIPDPVDTQKVAIQVCQYMNFVSPTEIKLRC